MNFLLTKLTFEFKRFKQFRKNLVLDYKKGGKHAHKNPHAIPLVLKQKLLNVHRSLLSLKKVGIGKQFDRWKDKV